MMTHPEALFYEKLDNQVVRCILCPHRCQLRDGQTGLCGVRSNEAGSLMTRNYGQVAALALDPIEKKPLYHFFPGTAILSTGSFGCNFDCSFCQNHHIAQQIPDVEYIAPESMLAMVNKYTAAGSIGIAFTYNEPFVWYEYIFELAPRLKEQGHKTVLVTNGFIEKEPLHKLLPYIDAVNIDVKSFTKEFYHKFCCGNLNSVLENVETLISSPIHTEITTLLIPGENDAEAEIRELSSWLASLDKNTVLHLSRYHPAYKMKLPPTPEKTLQRSQEIAREYLSFVYTGNLPGEENDTCCQICGNLLIHRNNYQVEIGGIKKGFCTECGAQIDYIPMI